VFGAINIQSGALTLSAWVKIASSGGQSQQCIISKNNGSTQRSFVLWAYTSFLTSPIAYIYSGASNYSVQATTNIRDGFWHHVMLVYTPSTSLNIYVDGVLEGSNTTSIPASINNATQNFEIGRFGSGTFQVLGNIDEVAVWDSDQNTNASTIYNGGAPTDLSSLSPLSWWRMGDGDTWGGSSWTLTDNGSGANDATSVNMEEADRLPISPNSYTQNSFSFDGVDEYLTLGNPTNLRLTADFSISCWMKFTDSGATRYALSMGDQYGIYTSSGTIRGFARIGGAFTSLTSVGTFNDGNWHHVMYVKNSTNMLLYIDGSLNASNTSGGTNTASALDQRIGARYTNANYYEGSLDELYIFDSDQSANISTIFNNGIPQDISSLSPLSHWRMGENATWNGSTWTLTDQGSGGNNATSVNMEEADKTGDQAYVI
jgi:ureidoglycolate hydrolase